MSSVQVQPSSASCLNNLLASITQAVNSADVAGAQSAIESLAAVALQVSDSSALAVVGALDAALTLSSNTTSPGSAQIAAPALAAIGTMLSTADETWSVDALMTSIPSDALASQHPAELTRRAAQSLARGASASAPLSCDSERVSTGSSNMETASLRASGSSAAGLQWHSADQSARFSLPSTLSNLASAAVSSECESSLSIGFIFYSKPSFFENDAQTLSFASTAGLARVANVVASALAVETTPSSSIVGASPTSTAAPAAGELVFSRFLLSSVIAADVVESSTDATPAGLYRFSLQILPNATHVLTTARILLAANSTTPHTVNPSATADWTTLAAAVECGFWNFSLHSEASPSGMWDTTGCQRVAVHSNGTVDCQCAHLTNFAVLFVTDRAAGTALASSVEGEALEYLTYIGCAVTIVGCLITIVTFLVFRSLRKVPIKLLLILCGSIVLVQLFFILSTSLAGTASNAGCIALGVLFHYVLLLQFFSSFVHGLHLFRSIATTELSTSLDRSFRQYVRVIVLAPALLMCVYIAIFAAATGGDLDGVYGDMFDDGRICFIPSAVGAICSLAVPVLLIIAVNFVIFFKIARIMVHANKLFDGAYAHNAKVFAGMTALLGLSWGLGLLVMVSDSQSVFVWLFVICNGLQGVILAFVYCTSDQVKGAYRELLSTLNSTRSTHVGTLESPAGSNNHSGLGGGAAPLLAHQALARQPTNVRVIRVERLSNQVLLRKQPSGDLTHAAPQTPQTPQGANLRNAAEYSELRARSKSTPVLYDALDQAQIAALAGPSSLQQQDNDHIYHRPADQLEVPKTQLGRCKSEDLKTNQSHRRSNSELFHKKSRSPRASSPRPASPGSQGTSVMHSIRSLLTPSSANSTATLNLEHQMMVNLGVYDDVRASVVEPDLDLEDILIIDDSADSTHSDPKKRYRFVSKRPDSHAGLQRPLFAPPSPGDSAASSRHTSSTFASNHDLSDQKAAEALGNHVSPAAAQGYDFPLARLRYDDTPQSYYEAMRFESEAV
ncbi:hypothetical protein CAOG_00001 [Capsaspora owczarzaki ATCC 30864]|nr:hypothetical protein CAOG_00001 [Capsaspora owczarzaki ATCC 30864]|eukprot:XP_004364872.1 hypothetical protein CAOG_00001 [Capsaspora owczarzaki ATCC 30864]